MFWRKRPVQWIARILLFTMLYTFCGGAEATEWAEKELKRRAATKEFAKNLGIDPQKLLNPETPDERTQRIEQTRKDTYNWLRSQICTTATEEEIAKINAGMDQVKTGYLPDRVVGLAKTIQDLDKRLEKESLRVKQGKSATFTGIDLAVYHEAFSLGYGDIEALIQATDKQLREAKMPQEIIDRTIQYQKTLKSETGNLKKALSTHLIKNRKAKRLSLESGKIDNLRQVVGQSINHIKAALNEGTPAQKSHQNPQDRTNKDLNIPIGGGNSSGGGSGIGGGGGDDGQSGYRAKIVAIFHSAGGAGNDGSGGTGGDPVDLGNGVFMKDEIDFTVAVNGDVAGVRRRYRSNNEGQSAFGHRWYYGYSIFLTEAMNGDVTLTNDDAREYVFAATTGEIQYELPEELDATLKKEESNFLLETGGYIFTFDENGKFLSRCDGSDNCLVMVYDATGDLEQVDDKDGLPIIEFTYNAAGYIASASGRGDRLFTYTYDEDGNIASAANKDGEQTTYTYFDNHLLASITDPKGHTLQIFYDGDGRVHRQVDPEGNTETFSYDFINHTTVVTDGNGNSRSVVHDPNGRVKEAYDPLGNVVYHTYDDRGRLTSETDEFGNITTYEYSGDDSCGTCGVTKVTRPDRSITYTSYNEFGREVTRTERYFFPDSIAPDMISSATYVYDASGHILGFRIGSEYPGFDQLGKRLKENQTSEESITYERNEKGQVTRVSSDSGTDINYNYDEKTGVNAGKTYPSEDADGNPVMLASNTMMVDDAGLPVGFIDGAGKQYTTTTNARGMPTLLTSPDPGSSPIKVEYDENGLIKAVTRGNDIVSRYEFDGNYHNTVVDDPQIGRKEKVYDGAGNVIAIVDALGRKTEFEYNAINQQTLVMDAQGNPIDFLYCGNSSKPGGQVGPTGEGLLMEYDVNDRLVRSTNTLGQSTIYAYDAGAEKPTLVQDAEGNTTESVYDPHGRLIQVKDAEGNITSYEYGPHSNQPIKIIDAELRQWLYVYDGLGRLIRETDPLNRTTKHYYDGSGNETRIVYPDGKEAAYTYDSWNRRIAATYPDSTTASWTYIDGLLTEEATSKRIKRYEYDSDAHITKVTDVNLGQSLEYTYTATGNVHTIQDDQGGMTTYTYDELDQVIAIQYPNGKRVVYEYDESGRRYRSYFPNGIRTEIEYNSVGRVASIIHYSPDDTPFEGQSFSYDKVGNILSETDHTGTVKTYTYDNLYRIKEVRINGALKESYAYDKVGNILTQTIDGQTSTFTYDAAHQLATRVVTTGTTTYQYDMAGRLIQKTSPEGITTYTYTEGDRLAKVDLPGGKTIEYEYDAAGRLLSRDDGTDAVDYLIDREHVYADYSGSTQVEQYHRGTETDELVGSTPDGEDSRYYQQNHLKSVKVETGIYGDIEGRRTYSAYGQVKSDTGVGTRFGYTGRESDSDTGLSYYRARWYMPDAGRFTTLDPQRGEITNPASLHRSMYTMNNPINYNDPSGFGIGTAFMDYLGIQSSIALGLAKTFVSCYSPIAALIVGFYDIYYGMIASLMDLLFTYGNMPGSNCALGLLMAIHFVCQILNIIAAATWTSCMSKIWEKLLASLISEAIKAIAGYVQKLILDALKTGKPVSALVTFIRDYLFVAMDIYLGLCSGVGIALGVIKLFMAPELCIGFCLLYQYS